MIARLVLLAWLSASHSATLTWQWSANNVKATAFSVQRGDNMAGPFHQIATVPLTSLTYVDKAVKVRAKPYCYQVIALAKKGASSPPSNVACAVIP